MDVVGEWWKRKRRGNKFSSEDELKGNFTLTP
jgi:hypothetical protein